MFMRMGEMEKGSKCIVCKKEIGSGVQTLEGDICFPCMDEAKKKRTVFDIASKGIR